MGKRAMSPKQMAFVAEYLVDLNATQAAIRAGYSGKTAGAQGFDLLKKPEIADAIAAAQQERAARTNITADRVLKELGRIAFFDSRKMFDAAGNLKHPSEWDDDMGAVIGSIEVTEEYAGRGDERESIGFTKKVKVWDKVAALTMAMRHLGMLVDKREISGPGGKPIQTEDVSAPRPRLAPNEWLLAHGVDLKEIADVGPATGTANVRAAG